jgi:DNA-directed RNA polymerase specialized sigma24 family protein
MATGGSVTNWLAQIKLGDQEAAQKLWERYFQQLVRLARDRLGRMPRAGFDEEDVAAIAFASFCSGAEEGRFPSLSDRQDLWQLLIAITGHKAIDAIRTETRKKRGGGKVQNQGWRGGDDDEGPASLLEVIGSEPSPEFAAILAEDFRNRLAQLDDGILRRVAVKKMEGYANTEIAVQLDCAPRTIERKLQLIRRLWTAQDHLET